MADDDAPATRIERLISWAASVVAPLSVLTAVLFYFGYASSRAQYQYFGIDVDTIGLSTQDYVMRSPVALLTPLLVLVLIGVGSRRRTTPCGGGSRRRPWAAGIRTPTSPNDRRHGSRGCIGSSGSS